MTGPVSNPWKAGLDEPFQHAPTINGSTVTLAPTSQDITTALRDAISGLGKTAGVYDEVVIPTGTWNVTETITLKSRVSIRGAGAGEGGTVLNVPASTSLAAMFSGGRTGEPRLSDVTLSDFHVTAATTATLTIGIRLGQSVYAWDTDPSTTHDCERITIRKVKIENFYRMAFSLEDTKWVLIESSQAHNARAFGDGGQGYGFMISGVHANNNWLTGCDVYNIRHGFLIETRARNNLVEYCTGSDAHTSNNGSADIVDFHGEQEYRNEVRFCKLHDSVDGAGIGMAEWSPGTSGSHEWSGDGNWVHDNEIWNCRYGIRHVWSPRDQPNFEGDSSGAAWVTTWSQVIERNSVHDNVDDGIRCDLGDTYRVHILGNTLAANGGYGIYLAENSTEYNVVGNKTAGQTNGKRVYRGSSNGTYVAGD